jgi:hypothetical protein
MSAMVMPPNGLNCAEKGEMDFQNEPKKCIPLPILRLRRIFFGSFFRPIAAQSVRKEVKPQVGLTYNDNAVPHNWLAGQDGCGINGYIFV